MRPDRPFPVYKEVARSSRRRSAPRHVGAGEIQPWPEFVAHLLPNKVEREWFLDWLAHKLRNPASPASP